MFNLCFTSKDGFYTSEHTEHDLPNGSSTNLVWIRPTGRLAFSVASYPKGQDVLIASCCLKTNSIYIQTAGMSVHPEDVGLNLVFFGLAAGTYKVQLKSTDTNQDYVVESQDIDVHVKSETKLGVVE